MPEGAPEVRFPVVAPPPVVTVEPLREPPPLEPLREPPANAAPLTPNPMAASIDPAPAAAASRRSMTGVQDVLDRYRRMYAQLDATSASSIWPQADTRALDRVFARLQRQELDFDDCVIAVSEASATAECAGTLRYVPKVGNPEWRSERHSWTIQLKRTAESWTIDRVSAR